MRAGRHPLFPPCLLAGFHHFAQYWPSISRFEKKCYKKVSEYLVLSFLVGNFGANISFTIQSKFNENW